MQEPNDEAHRQHRASDAIRAAFDEPIARRPHPDRFHRGPGPGSPRAARHRPHHQNRKIPHAEPIRPFRRRRHRHRRRRLRPGLSDRPGQRREPGLRLRADRPGHALGPQPAHRECGRMSAATPASSGPNSTRPARCSAAAWSVPQTEDGHKVVFWHDDKVDVWFKTKNVFADLWPDTRSPAHAASMAMACDPKMTVVGCRRSRPPGRVADRDADACRGGRTDRPDRDVPAGQRRARTAARSWRVDPATKLVRWIDKSGAWSKASTSPLGRIDILEYNQPIDPAVYQPAVARGRHADRPDDAGDRPGQGRDDRRAGGQGSGPPVLPGPDRQGLRQGRPAVRRDAGAEDRRGASASSPIVRIVSIGEPTPEPRTRGLRVPCPIEVEKDGVRQIVPSNPCVRPVESQPDRWHISGGI